MRIWQIICIGAIGIAACGGGAGNTPTGPGSGSGATGGNPGGTGSGSTGGGSTGQQVNTVSIGNDFFNPTSLTVPVGTTVTWSWNNDAVTHNVTFTDGTTSGDRNAGDTYQRTFATAGTYAYHCTIHEGMNGQIVVQ